MANTTYTPISPAVSADEIMKFRQDASQQKDGKGLRVGNKAEFTLLAPLAQGGADLFRQRLSRVQTEAAYWEGRVGTVHDLRVVLIADRYVLFAATYSQDFKPYVLDVIKFATPWIDEMFLGVADGYPGLGSPDAIAYIQKYQVEASVWYASNEEATVRDVAKAQQLSKAFNALLDIAQS
jgi:hypothetical protein